MKDINTFNPEAWQTSKEKPSASRNNAQQPQTFLSAGTADDIEIITQRIESARVDITQGYENWRDIGFALVSQLGENGRSYYHRISRFHPEYNESSTDDQYDKCLRSHGTGITINTFFGKAQDAGIDLRTGKTSGRATSIPPKSPKTPSGDIGETGDSENIEQVNLPTFYDEVKDKLPPFIKRIVAVGESPQESDAMTLGAITVISSCLPNVFGEYDCTTVYPNLFFFLTARASSGKGRINFCRQIVQPIHREMKDKYREEYSRYEEEMAAWKAKKKDERGTEPKRPIRKRIFIPANNSSTGTYELLGENDERGLIFETEGDTLANTFGTDYGDFSDGFRKAFHHETISYHRRQDKEDVEIERPKLSAVLTGTPKQVTSLIKDAENGLFSRFMFYRLNSALVWKDVFAEKGVESLNMLFDDIGADFHTFYTSLKDYGAIRFSLTRPQRGKFHSYFTTLQQEYYNLFKDDILASVRRLGLIFFRIAMILSTIRYVNSDEMPYEIICRDDDFDTAMAISKVLAVHTAKIFEELSSAANSKIADIVSSTKRQRFLDALPSEFDRQDYLESANRVGVPPSTAEKWIRTFCGDGGPLEKVEHGQYIKK